MVVTAQPKAIRRKVLKAEQSYGRVPGLLLDLDCGHFVEITGWGNGSGIAPPKTTICDYCSGRKKWRSKANG